MLERIVVMMIVVRIVVRIVVGIVVRIVVRIAWVLTRRPSMLLLVAKPSAGPSRNFSLRSSGFHFHFQYSVFHCIV